MEVLGLLMLILSYQNLIYGVCSFAFWLGLLTCFQVRLIVVGIEQKEQVSQVQILFTTNKDSEIFCYLLTGEEFWPVITDNQAKTLYTH